MNEEYTFKFIERYLEGTLSPEELKAFQEELHVDEALAEAVEKQRLTHKATDLYAQLVTKEKVKGIHNKVKRRTAGKRIRVFSLAASVAILLVAGLGYQFTKTRYANENLVQMTFHPYPDRITTMGVGTEEILGQGMEAYKQGQWAEARALLATVPDSSNNFDAAQLYLGISAMQIREYDQAIPPLSRLVEKENAFSEAAQWYLALAYLGAGNEDLARAQLQAILKAQRYQHEEARKLLHDLDSFWRIFF